MTSALAYSLPCPRCGVVGGERCVNRDGSPASRSHVKRAPIQPCGSLGGYHRHTKAGEEPCDPCREANRRYMQAYRQRNPARHEADIAKLRARREATKKLIALHRQEFAALCAESEAAAS